MLNDIKKDASTRMQKGVAQALQRVGRGRRQRGEGVLDQRGNAKESDAALKKG